MKKFIIPLLIILTVSACTSKDKIFKDTNVITLVNNYEFKRVDEPIIISKIQLGELIGEIPDAKIPVLKDESGKILASQVDDLDKDGQWDELFFVTEFEPHDSCDILIEFVDTSEIPDYIIRTNIRFAKVPEETGNEYIELTGATRLKSTETEISSKEFQMEGPAWENDKVGFRNYFDARNGIDIFGKRVPEMALDNVGISKSYHEMQEWGMDILKVGNSLGAGALALFENGTLYRLGASSEGKYELVTEGPLRSIFKLYFKDWQIGDNKYDLIQEISIMAGCYYFESKIILSGIAEEKTLVTGIVNKYSDSLIVEDFNSEYISIATHCKQAELDKYLGMGILFNKASFIDTGSAPDEGEGIVETYYAKLKIRNNEPVTFCFFTGWELSDSNFTDAGYFIDLIRDKADRLTHPIKIMKK